MSLDPSPNIGRHLLNLGIGREQAGNLRELADAVRAFGSFVETELNQTLGALRREVRKAIHDDCRGDVDAIGECFSELVSLIEHAAEEADQNAREVA